MSQAASLSIRLDWADLDLFGHVNNVAFFKYIQAARVSFCEQAGLTSLNEPGRLGFMVASSQCQFKKPLHYPGEITVLTTADWIKNSSFQLSHRIFNQCNELAAEGTDVLVVFDYEKKTKVNVPEEIRKAVESLSAQQ